MNESDLLTLLQHGSRRLRAARALRVSLAVLGLSGLALAATLFLWRTYAPVAAEDAARIQTTQALLIAIPFLLAATAFAILYALAHPADARVASALDKSARLQDHLITWLELRAQNLPEAQSEFRTAQAKETLRLAAGLSPAKLLPLRLPNWTPALWLALILLCSALLVPPQIEAESKAAAREREQSRRRAPTPTLSMSDSQPGAIAGTTPRVQPLSPTELWKLQLRASDPSITPEQKRQLLNELQQKTGAIPEGELTTEIRELLSQLREPDAAAKPTQTEKPAGSGLLASNNGTEKPSQVQPAAANEATIRERGLARAANDFVDVKEELIRYYSGGIQK